MARHTRIVTFVMAGQASSGTAGWIYAELRVIERGVTFVTIVTFLALFAPAEKLQTQGQTSSGTANTSSAIASCTLWIVTCTAVPPQGI